MAPGRLNSQHASLRPDLSVRPSGGRTTELTARVRRASRMWRGLTLRHHPPTCPITARQSVSHHGPRAQCGCCSVVCLLSCLEILVSVIFRAHGQVSVWCRGIVVVEEVRFDRDSTTRLQGILHTEVCPKSFRRQAITYEYSRGNCHPATANLLQSRSKIAPCALYS
jgi:hypothetical protein